MKKAFLCLLILCLVPSIYAATKKKPKPPKHCGATSSTRDGNCPQKGCGGDPLLNVRKNLLTAAASPQTYTRADFVKLKFPKSWKSGTPRTKLNEWGEGTPVVYEAYLMKVKHYQDGIEACNCNLTLDRNNDFHLVTVTSKNENKEKTSITGEITPRFRPAGWTLTKLQKLARDRAYIKMTGYLMLDTQHVGESVPARVTHWEIHPVTAFKVCNGTVTSCKAGNDWQDLSDYPEP